MSTPRTEQRINVHITDISSIAEFLPEHELADYLGLDSLDRTELMMLLEDEFSIQIGDEAFQQIVTVKQLYDFIESTIKQGETA